MKFRSKGIISGSIIAFFTLFSLGTLIDMGTLYIFLLVLSIYVIAIIIRYNTYVELDDEGIIQTKYNLLLKRQNKTISYRDIVKIEFGKNHTLSTSDTLECGHYIYSTSGETIKIGKIFHLKKFKEALKEKKYLMTNYMLNGNVKIGNENIEIGGINTNNSDININDGNTFLSYEGILKLENEKIYISKCHDGKQETLCIQYQDIEQIEVVIVEEDNTCIYIKLKNQKLKEVFYGITDGKAFMNAMKKRGINAYYVSSDVIISDLKDEDLY